MLLVINTNSVYFSRNIALVGLHFTPYYTGSDTFVVHVLSTCVIPSVTHSI